MQANTRARLSAPRRIAAAGLLLAAFCTTTSRADVILLSAPSANSSYYGMWSPYPTEASFTLAGSYHVSSISAVFRTPASTTFTTFQLSLQSAVTNPPTIFASQNLTAAVGAISTLTLNINQTLPAGTYYLAAIVPGYAGTPGTPGDVDGWLLSTGVYNQSAGSIVNGVYVGANPPVFDTGGVYVAPAFTVIGSVVPEPSSAALLGAAALLALRRREQ